MRRRPPVSVIMSVYNDRRFVGEAVSSVLGQTWRDFEFIIVDDGSNDGSEKVVDEISDARVAVIHQENCGRSKARNRALREASGEFIAVCDADDTWEPGRLEEQLDFLAEHREVKLLGAYGWYIDGAGRRGEIREVPLSRQEIATEMRNGCAFIHSSTIFSRECAVTLGGYREAFALAQDYDFFLRFVERWPAANLPVPLCCYRVHDISESAAKWAVRQEYGRLAWELAQERRERGTDRVERGEELLSESDRARIRQARSSRKMRSRAFVYFAQVLETCGSHAAAGWYFLRAFLLYPARLYPLRRVGRSAIAALGLSSRAHGRVNSRSDRSVPRRVSLCQCKLCFSKNAEARYALGGGLRVLVCRECGFHFVDYLRPMRELKAGAMAKINPGPASYIRDHLQHNEERVARNIGLLERLAGSVSGKRCLDVGAGGGLWLDRLRERGAVIAGCEIDAERIAFAKMEYDIELIPKSIEDDSWPEEARGSFDVITLWDVLEHLNNPFYAMKRCRDLLAPGGLILLDTPIRDCLYDYLSYVWYVMTWGRSALFLSLKYSRHHLQIFHSEELRAMFRALGLAPVYWERRHEMSLPIESYVRRLPVARHSKRLAPWAAKQVLKLLPVKNKVVCAVRDVR